MQFEDYKITAIFEIKRNRRTTIEPTEGIYTNYGRCWHTSKEHMWERNKVYKYRAEAFNKTVQDEGNETSNMNKVLLNICHLKLVK